MAINFPLSFPSTPSFKRLELREMNVVGLSESPTSLEQQTYEWDGSRWEASVTWPAMARASAEPVEAVISAMRGKAGRVLIGDPSRKTPRGTATGYPVTRNDTAVRSLTVDIRRWTPSLATILKQGDHLQICKNYLTFPIAFDNAIWTKNTGTITSSVITDPDGNNIARRFTPNVAATDAYVRQTNLAITDSILNRVFTFAVYLKAAAGTPTVKMQLRRVGGTGIEQNIVLTTSWVRYELTGTPETATDGDLEVLIRDLSEADGAIDIWGASLWSTELDVYLHKVSAQADIASDVNGISAGIDIWPKTRIAVPDFSPVVTSSPKGQFRRASNKQATSIDEAGIHYVACEFVEAQ